MKPSALFALSTLAAALVLPALPAWAHCDSVDGPVASAAVRALDAANVNLVLPYAPAAAEAELKSAFDQARRVRGLDPAAKTLADRWFMETAVRLHRAGEGAPFTGLQRAGTDFGPAIPAAERALASGDLAPLQTLLAETVRENTAARFAAARAHHAAPTAPASAADVPAARERVSAEFAFVEFVEAIRQSAAKGAGHGEGVKDADERGHR